MKTLIATLRHKFQRSIVLVFLFVIITIALFLKLIQVNKAEMHSTAQLISETDNITRYAVTIEGTLAETESAVRGYLLTANPKLKETAIRNQEKTKQLITEVSGLVNDPEQAKRSSELNMLIGERMELQKNILTTGDIDGYNRAGIDERLVQNSLAINELVAQFQQRQAVLLHQRTEASKQANHNALQTVLLGTGIAFLFITGILLKLNQDIRRRKQAEQEIRSSEKKYRLLVEDAGMTIFTCNLTGIFTYVSGKCEVLTGYTSDELTGQNFAMLVDPDWLSVVTDEYVTQLHQFWSETTIEFPILTRDGTRKWVEQYGVLVLDELRSPVGYQCMVRDITEKRGGEVRPLEVA